MKKLLLLSLFVISITILSGLSSAQGNDSDMKSSGNIYNITQAEEMDLHGKNLSVFPAEVLEMKNLRILDLSNNQISTIPVEIKNLKNLSVLKLNGNKICSLPEGISRLKMLKEIYLDHYYWCFRIDEIRKITDAKIILVD